MSIPPYRWRCLACDRGNAAASKLCEHCGCPARPRHAQIQRYARLAALRADKIFPPVDADLSAVEPAGPSSLRTACLVLAVLFSWAIVAVVVRLSMAPVAGSRVGGWVLNAMMATIVVLAALTSVIVYRSARRAHAES